MKIIFDLFGTLLNEDGIYEKFFKLIDNKYDLKDDHHLVKNFFIIQRRYIFKNSKLPFDKIIVLSLKELIPEFNENDLNLLWDLYSCLDFHEGRIDSLRKLKSKFELYVLSNTNSVILKRIVKFQNNIKIFHKVFTSEEIGHYKPSKESYSYVTNALKEEPSEILYCTDTDWDFVEAGNFGFQTINTSDLDGLK